MSISGIAHYDGGLLADPSKAVADLQGSIDRCARLGIDVLCAVTGQPPAGMTKEEAIDGPVTDIFGPVAEHAAANGVKVGDDAFVGSLSYGFAIIGGKLYETEWE